MEVAGVRRPRRQWLSNSGYKNAMQCIYPAVAADRMDREGAWGHDGLWPFIYNQLLDIGSQSMRLETLDSGLPRTRRGLGNSWVLATTCFLKMTTTPTPSPQLTARPSAGRSRSRRPQPQGGLFAVCCYYKTNGPATNNVPNGPAHTRASSTEQMAHVDCRRETRADWDRACSARKCPTPTMRKERSPPSPSRMDPHGSSNGGSMSGPLPLHPRTHMALRPGCLRLPSAPQTHTSPKSTFASAMARPAMP
jgi:hypothetical protein